MPQAVAGTVAEALRSASDALRAAGVEGPRLDAELLLAAALEGDRAELATAPERGIEAPAARAFGAMIRRRVAREPVAYILGSKGFRAIELRVDSRVLIPRPESELLVELAVELAPGSVLDVGTGSGALALAIADELPAAEVVATDVSRGAVAVAAANAERLGLADRVRIGVGTVPEPRRFDLVVANLPYVRSDEWQGLSPEITRYEPRGALLAGEDGLLAIRSLLDGVGPEGDGGNGEARVGAIGLEVGDGQAGAVARLVEAAGFSRIEVRRDLAGIERCVVGCSG